MLIDSHSHLFSEEFNEDLSIVVDRAKAAGLTHIFLPNIDSTSIEPMLEVAAKYKDFCYPMIGLHPTSINAGNYKDELDIVKSHLDKPNNFVAVGEIGIDLYWDKTYLKEQQHAFDQQLQWALEYNLPVVIHSRESFDEIIAILDNYRHTSLKGIFHSFTGDQNDAARLLEFNNFMLGINGVVTFKKSHLPAFLSEIPLERIVLETDSPYLTPAPFRGKRNESAYLTYILARLADIYCKSESEVAEITSQNTLRVFEVNNFAF